MTTSTGDDGSWENWKHVDITIALFNYSILMQKRFFGSNAKHCESQGTIHIAHSAHNHHSRESQSVCSMWIVHDSWLNIFSRISQSIWQSNEIIQFLASKFETTTTTTTTTEPVELC